jgi:hypothetical protein
MRTRICASMKYDPSVGPTRSSGLYEITKPDDQAAAEQPTPIVRFIVLPTRGMKERPFGAEAHLVAAPCPERLFRSRIGELARSQTLRGNPCGRAPNGPQGPCEL